MGTGKLSPPYKVLMSIIIIIILMYVYTHCTTQRWRDMVFIEMGTQIIFIHSISQPESNGSGFATKFSHFMSFYPAFYTDKILNLASRNSYKGFEGGASLPLTYRGSWQRLFIHQRWLEWAFQWLLIRKVHVPKMVPRGILWFGLLDHCGTFCPRVPLPVP